VTRRWLWVGLMTAPAVALGIGFGLTQPRARESADPLMSAIERAARDLTRPVRVVAPISDEEENKVGAELASKIPSRASDRVSRVGNRLLIHVRRTAIDYHFEAIEAPAETAFALPGGRIYVTTGLLNLTRDDDELAGVIGHEIAHVELGHCADSLRGERTLGKVLQEVLEPAYSETMEREADQAGAALAKKGGYDPLALARLFDRMAKDEPPRAPDDGHRSLAGLAKDAVVRYHDTHPRMADRARAIRERGR